MEVLPEDVLAEIVSLLPVSFLFTSLCKVSRGIREVASPIVKERAERVFSFLPVWMPAVLPLPLLMDGKEVRFERRWLGGTGYIDGVGGKDVQTGVSYGKDIYSRSFCAVKSQKGEVIVLFQRYTNGIVWKVGSCYPLWGGESVNVDFKKRIRNWLGQAARERWKSMSIKMRD